MRIFQTIRNYPPYLPHFEHKYKLSEKNLSFEEHRNFLIKDRFFGVHLLKPILDYSNNAFYTIWDYPALQIKWAKEKGWNETDLKKILFAQVEEFNPDVFYTNSSISFSAEEIRKLGNKHTVKCAWWASPEKCNIDFSVYNTRLTNNPLFLKDKSEIGFRSDYFYPSYDPGMNEFAISEERPIDIFFYGQYIDRYFDKRNELINKLVRLKKENNWNIKISLQYNSFYRTPHFNNKITRALMRYFNIIGFPPADIRRNSVNPYYGLDLYEELSKSKIIFNASADFAQNYQFNMRNIESMGCGAHMLSADGIYPDHFGKGSDFSVYSSFEDFVDKAGYFLNHENVSRQIALQGHKTVSTYYSKDIQWLRFIEIVNNL